MQQYNYFAKNQQRRLKADSKLAIENYVIAAIAGITIGWMLAQFVKTSW